MTSEGLGEMFEGDSADTCAGKFPLTAMGAERRVSRAQTRERGPHRRERNFQASQNVQPEKKWAPFYFWMYRHGEDLPCTGKSGKNSEPFLEECVIHAILDCVMRDVLVKFAQLFLYW